MVVAIRRGWSQGLGLALLALLLLLLLLVLLVLWAVLVNGRVAVSRGDDSVRG